MTENQGYVLQCGRSLTTLARSCGDAFRGSVGGLSEQHRTVLQYVMRMAIAQTQTLPHTQTQPHTQDYTPSPSVSHTPHSNSGTTPGSSGIINNTPGIQTEAPSPVMSPAPASAPIGSLKFDVSPSSPSFHPPVPCYLPNPLPPLPASLLPYFVHSSLHPSSTSLFRSLLFHPLYLSLPLPPLPPSKSLPALLCCYLSELILSVRAKHGIRVKDSTC